MLGELWNHACPPYPPLFAAEEYDYFRKRQSKAVKLPNPARFRKLHLKTDIAITKSQELNFRGSSFQNFTGDCLQRSNHAWPTLKYAPRLLCYAPPTRTYPVRYIDTTCLAASRCKILMNPRENVAEQSRSLAKPRALLASQTFAYKALFLVNLNRHYTKNVFETRLVLQTWWSSRLFSLSCTLLY